MKNIIDFLALSKRSENFDKSNIITLKLGYYCLIKGLYNDFKTV